MRTLFALAALPLLTTFAPAALYRAPSIPEQARLWLEPVPLDEERPGRRRLGRLLYLGGWSLHSNDPRFGGISALHVENGALMALSDTGMLFGFRAPSGRDGVPMSVRQLLKGPGSPLRKKDRDTEAMVVHGRHAWIAYERRNVVWRYDRGTLTSSAASAPAGMSEWHANTGSEGMVRLKDGRFLIFSERVRRNGTSEALLFAGDAALAGTGAVSFSYRPPRGYRVTDAAVLPDGGLLFLNRRWSYLDGISAKLTLVERPKLEEGAILAGTEIANFAPPVTTDNFEALSVTLEGGRTILWIASDDNFIALQRSLLLKFALAE